MFQCFLIKPSIWLLIAFLYRFCKKIVLYDLSTRDKYTFLVEKWLSVYYVEKNLRLEWVLVPTILQETDWQNLARENFFINLRELHLWISIFVRYTFIIVLYFILKFITWIYLNSLIQYTINFISHKQFSNNSNQRVSKIIIKKLGPLK